MGAWIETVRHGKKSHRNGVAPYVGAWIETKQLPHIADIIPVAPYVGAWIETPSSLCAIGDEKSHPTWVRGLKLHLLLLVNRLQASHPTWVRGLKLEPESNAKKGTLCRTLRGCVD